MFYVTFCDVLYLIQCSLSQQENSLRGLVRQLSIDQLDNEGRRVGVYDGKDKSPMFARAMSQPVRERWLDALYRSHHRKRIRFWFHILSVMD